jgi:hypothetical protein
LGGRVGAVPQRSAAQVWTGGGAAKDEGGKAEAWSYLEIDDAVARRPSDSEIGRSDMTCGNSSAVSRFRTFFLGNGNQIPGLLRCESGIVAKGTSAVYTGKHTWPSLSRPALGTVVTLRVGGYIRPCGRVSGNGLGETESHWENFCRRRLCTRAGERRHAG